MDCPLCEIHVFNILLKTKRTNLKNAIWENICRAPIFDIVIKFPHIQGCAQDPDQLGKHSRAPAAFRTDQRRFVELAVVARSAADEEIVAPADLGDRILQAGTRQLAGWPRHFAAGA